MRLTAITDNQGKVLGAHKGYKEKDHLDAWITPLSNQVLHEIEVPDELDKITNPKEYLARVQQHVHKKK